MVEMSIKLACGEPVDIENKFNVGSAIRYFPACNGTIQSIEGIENVKTMPGIKEVSVVHREGETIGAIGSSVDRIGFVIAQAETNTEAVAKCEAAIKAVHIHMV